MTQADVLRMINGPVRSYVVSQLFALQTIVVTAGAIGYTLGPANGGYNDWPSFVAYVGHVWFAVFAGLFFGVGPFVRAHQGYKATTPLSPVAADVPRSTEPPASSPPR